MKRVLERAKPGGDGVSDNLIRIELITHFHRHPGLEGTPEEMAEAIGREPERVRKQIVKLVHLGILEENRRNGRDLYRYVTPCSVAAYVAKRSCR